jgi:hypothetical protein
MKNRLSLFFSLIVCLAVFLSPAHGQEVTAGIYGTVQDATGAVIPGTEIVMTNVDTGRTLRTTSDATGGFTITLVPLGNYSVSAEAAGFRTSVVTGVILRVNDNRRIIFNLAVGEVSESITVEASAVTVNTASGETSAHLDGDELINIPSTGRYVLPFAMLMPGVVSDRPNSRRDNRAAVNGVRPTHNAWLLDGGYNIDTGGNWGAPLAPNIEGVAEFRAIRGNYTAEFGTGGGSQFNVVTKSGTNQYHGALYYFLRNEKLNARNFFQPERQAFKGNEFGASFGGPVKLPGYNGQDKTFFFVLLGWNRERTQQRFLEIIPDMAVRQGDFSGLDVDIIDPSTGNPFPNNIIPSNRHDRNALAYTQMYSPPNFIDSAGRNFTTVSPFIDDRTDQSYRIDHNFSENYRLMGRYYREYRNSERSESPGFDFLRRMDETPANNIVINLTSVIRPTLISDFNFTRSHNRIMQFPPDLSGSTWGISIPQLVNDTETNYPLDSLNLSAVPDRVPNVTFDNYANIAPGAPWSNYQSIFEFKESLTWIRGAHTIKFGGLYAYEKKFEPTETNVFGSFRFDGRKTGDPWSDFLLGQAESYQESDTVAFNDNRRNALEFYINDSWKATRRLTLSLGVRYAYFPAATEADDKFRAFRPNNYDPANAVTVNGSGQVIRDSGDRLNGLVNPADYWNVSKKNFAPRFSFAYDLTGNGRTAVRGGYGIFSSREILGAFILMSGNPPFQEVLTLFNPQLSNPGGGTARDFDLPITLGSIDTNQETPYTQQWNLNIQHGLAANTVLEVGYSGSRAIHMMRTQDLNQPLANAAIANSTANANQLRPYKGWGVISHREQSYMSNYHGLQIGLNRNFSRGFGTKIAYTFAKAIDNADFTGGIYGFVPNTQDSSGERGRANFDATHRFVMSYIYDIPFLRGRTDLVGRVFGGWSISGITTFQTGLPLNPQLGRDYAGVGSSSRQRPATTGSPGLDRSERNVDQWFNTSAYVAPEFGTFAPPARNILSLPGVNNWDLSMNKSVSIKEGTEIEIWAQMFNVFNHTQFGGPNLDGGVGNSFFSASFGKVTNARNERSIMLGLRLAF